MLTRKRCCNVESTCSVQLSPAVSNQLHSDACFPVRHHTRHEFWSSMSEDILTLGFGEGRQGTRTRGMAWLQSSVIDMHLLHRWYR